MILLALLPFRDIHAAATPLISTSEANPPDCYYHMDGQIWVYSKSAYKVEIKRAVKKLNRKFDVFKYTSKKSKADVVISDKKSRNNYLGITYPSLGRIYLYKKQMNKLSKAGQITAIAHELCHAAGLNHSKDKKSLMYYRMQKKTQSKGLSKEDLKALRKARKRAVKRNDSERRKHLRAFLSAEKYGYAIMFYKRDGNFMVLSFEERGATYSSSNNNILKAYPNGLIYVKSAGRVTLTVKNAGVKHKFRIIIK